MPKPAQAPLPFPAICAFLSYSVYQWVIGLCQPVSFLFFYELSFFNIILLWLARLLHTHFICIYSRILFIYNILNFVFMMYVKIMTKSRIDKKNYFSAMAFHTYFVTTRNPKIKSILWLDDLISREFEALKMATGEWFSFMSWKKI